MAPKRPETSVRRISQRSVSLGTISYAEVSFEHCFQVNAGGRPGQAEPEKIRERLADLNQCANNLGFVSLLDACLAEARQRDRKGLAYVNVENFIRSECLDELLGLFGQRNEAIDADACRRAESTYVDEFKIVRQLDVMNHPASRWQADSMSDFSFDNLHSRMLQSAPNLLRLMDLLIAGVNTSAPDDPTSAQLSKHRRALVMVMAILAKTRNQ